MRRATLIAVSISAVATLWILSGQLFGGSDSTVVESETGVSQGDGVATAAPLPRVRVMDSEASLHVQELTLFGQSRADRSVDIRASTGSHVAKILVRNGTRVETGTEIVRLEMEDREARLAEAKAQVKFRELSFEAARSLAKKKFSAEVTVAGDFAELEAARARLQAIQLDVSRTEILSPFEGLIDDIPVEVGDLVAVGDILAKLIDLDPIIVMVEVTERQVAHVKVGQQARVLFANGLARTGIVTFVSRNGNDTTRTFKVEVEVANKDFVIPQGSTTEVMLSTDPVMAHHVSPAILTLGDSGQLGVKIVDGDGLAVFMPITIAAESDAGIWIEGLPSSARLITVGQEFVSDGQLVEAVPAGGS